MVAPENDHDAVMVLVLGSSVVGRALELLLRSADLSVRFVDEPLLEDLPGRLDEVKLLLIAPGISDELRRGVLKLAEDRPLAKRIPVLELISGDKELQEESEHPLILWPCPIEELKRCIQAALLRGGPASQDA